MSYKTYTPQEIIKFARENSPYYKELYKDIPENALEYEEKVMFDLQEMILDEYGIKKDNWKRFKKKKYNS